MIEHNAPTQAADSTAPNDPVQPTLVAHRYELVEKIAEGGMGAVYRAVDRTLARDVAIKLVKHVGNEQALRRFRAESQITGQLQHPGIPPVHDLGTLDDGQPYLAMKLIKGRTLAELLADRGRPEYTSFVPIFEQVCQAVAYAHSRGVIHRDLKPANVMVGAFGEVQVMDWGLARVLGALDHEEPADDIDETQFPATKVHDPRATPEGATQTGVLIGTPAFIAPEQAAGAKGIDQRADVFGLGALLCVILTGDPPYVGPEPRVMALRGQLDGCWRRLDASGVEPELVALAKHCLDPDAPKRPRDAAAVATEVAAFRTRAEQRARQAELERVRADLRATEQRKRHRWQLSLAAALLAFGLAAGVTGWRIQRQRAADATRRHEVEQNALMVLSSARGQMETAWRGDDGRGLLEARANAEKAHEIAHNGGARVEVQEQTAAFLGEAQARVTRAEMNQRLRDALLDVVEPREFGDEREAAGQVVAMAMPSVDEQFRAAFRRWGIDVDADSLETCAARFVDQPPAFVLEAVAGLDAWAVHRRVTNQPESAWRRVTDLADRLDRNERRRELRRMLGTGDLLAERLRAEIAMAFHPAMAAADIPFGPLARRLREMAEQMDAVNEPVLGVLVLARTLDLAGEGRRAETVLRAALAARPDSVALLDSLAKLLARQGPRQLDQAIACLQAMRALRPASGLGLASALMQAERFADQERVLRDLARRLPENPEVHFFLAIALQFQHKPDDAIAANRRAVALKPDLAEAHNNLGLLMMKQKKMDEAIAAFGRAIEAQPRLTNAYHNLGLALLHTDRPAEAEKACRKVIELRPDFLEGHNHLGLALHEQGKLDEAVSVLRQAVERDPGYAIAHYNLGRILDDQKKRDEAEVAYRAAIAARSDFAEAHSNLASIQSARKLLVEAEAGFRRAIELKPSLDEPYYGLGNVLRDQQRLDEAIAAYRQGIDLNPNRPQPHCNLGLVLRNRGEFAAALVHLKRGHELGSLQPNWHYQSARWVEQTEQLLRLDERLTAVLAGREKATLQDQIALAALCKDYKQFYRAAARFLADALAAQPKLADDPTQPWRYRAACCAALAAAGQGKDAAKLDAVERASLRKQVGDWLRADLAAYAKMLPSAAPPVRTVILQRLRDWQQDIDLVGIRDTASLQQLPEAERKAWESLWNEVRQLEGK